MQTLVILCNNGVQRNAQTIKIRIVRWNDLLGEKYSRSINHIPSPYFIVLKNTAYAKSLIFQFSFLNEKWETLPDHSIHSIPMHTRR